MLMFYLIHPILNEVMNVLNLQRCVSFFFFFCLCTLYNITSRNNAQISNFGGGFRCKSEYPWCIIEVKNKNFKTVFKKKMTEKREFLRKTMSIKKFWMAKKT
ncbi:Uncharacterized protein FWK35_00035447 [Aphis craccivora]|uniref:Uncharacterized protein n=1 Tax=Aphis craccivora TaxID=307492 RepID=A0A6G0VRC4_APHCR|nr:Uncharacterized protein FWK35_00035447 [Aphis craccivora]